MTTAARATRSRLAANSSRAHEHGPTTAQLVFKADLEVLGLRVDAGEHRDRGGHDLRAWFITTCQEHGAHRDLLRVVTHTARSDVISGYTRATWPALCAEVSKLRVALLDGAVVPLSTAMAQQTPTASNDSRKVAASTGIAPAYG
jgi:hypothetical protein